MKEYTSLERVQAVLRGEIPDRLPVVPRALCSVCAQQGMTLAR